MHFLANPINELGCLCQTFGWYRTADFFYGVANRISPQWALPWFNRGLVAKMARKWENSKLYNLRATHLDPQFGPAWWNLGIASTALEDWATSRKAWKEFGIAIPDGEGPLNLGLGSIPIRINPNMNGEVVWCERLDPARARIASVPFSESGHAHGDLVLNDGQPVGFRMNGNIQVPVFNELALLKESNWNTYGAELFVPAPEDAQFLHDLAIKHEMVVEDWSAVEVLCRACSEGVQHSHETNHIPDPWMPKRKFGIAAKTENQVNELLSQWSSGTGARLIERWELLLERPR